MSCVHNEICYSGRVKFAIAILFGALLCPSFGQAAEATKSRPATKPAPLSAPSAATNVVDPVELEYLKLLAEDDAAQKEADKWIRDAQAFESKGAGISQATLTAKIEQRLEPVKKAYEDFLRRHPNHVKARLAFGSFLNDIHESEAAVVEWEKARQIDPKNPAAWNNLANYYGHEGPIEKAFEYYAKAIELDPKEPVYLQNLATITYLFRPDAMAIYQCSEEEVFNRALDLYKKALELDPENFILAHDLAQSYYGIRPMRVEEAITAWTTALKLAGDDIERQGIHLHLARVKLNSGRFEDARQHLKAVTHEMHSVLKERLEKNLAAKEAKARSTNAPPAASQSTK
jgi:tetratricopeptide (TPR) repeat protein